MHEANHSTLQKVSYLAGYATLVTLPLDISIPVWGFLGLLLKQLLHLFLSTQHIIIIAQGIPSTVRIRTILRMILSTSEAVGRKNEIMHMQ